MYFSHARGDEHLEVLSRFLREYSFLEVGGKLLPLVVEFYEWLHMGLSYKIKSAGAENSVQSMVKKLADEVESSKEYHVSLYEATICMYFFCGHIRTYMYDISMNPA